MSKFFSVNYYYGLINFIVFCSIVLYSITDSVAGGGFSSYAQNVLYVKRRTKCERKYGSSRGKKTDKDRRMERKGGFIIRQ